MELKPTDFAPERGRGMIEMIAVLALFGILTMADLGSFSRKSKAPDGVGSPNTVSLALDKTKALDLSNELNERLFSHHMQQSLGSGMPTDEYGPKTRGGYPIRLTFAEGGKFTVTVSGLSGGVCVQMLTMNAVNTRQITINGTAGGQNTSLCQKADNTLSYTFDTTKY